MTPYLTHQQLQTLRGPGPRAPRPIHRDRFGRFTLPGRERPPPKRGPCGRFGRRGDRGPRERNDDGTFRRTIAPF